MMEQEMPAAYAVFTMILCGTKFYVLYGMYKAKLLE